MPSLRLLIAFVTVAVVAAAQRPQADPVSLPRLTKLGPQRPDAAAWTVTARNEVERPRPTAKAGDEIVLRIDRDARLVAVVRLLEQLRTGGSKQVHLAGRLPNGREGTFTLALPKAAEPDETMTASLHRRRRGVPADSLVPLLTRLSRSEADPPFTLRIEAADDARFEPVLQALAAAQKAGVTSAFLRSTGKLLGAAARDGSAFAIDLGPVPHVRLSARALPQPRPQILVRTVGCLTPADKVDARLAGGGAGGRFGARGRFGRARLAEGVAKAIATGEDWLARTQRRDGSFPGANGKADITATALTLLAFLSDGDHLWNGERRDVLRDGIGWLVDQQQDDGRIGPAGPGSVRRHAVATCALVEAYGLSNCPLLHANVADACAWLVARADADGGLGDGTAGAKPDHQSTALGAIAIATANFFGIRGKRSAKDLAAWFECTPAQTPPSDAAAAIFGQIFSGLDPRKHAPLANAILALPATTNPKDAWAAYWTSCGAFQVGGRAWRQWRPTLTTLATEQQEGDDAGSWTPVAGQSRVATTALRVMTLQAYYRYSRLIR